MPFANGHTMECKYNLDPLGKIYISIAIAWTAILLVGAVFLVSKRQLPLLRMRNIPVAVSAVATLHVYWILCMVAYTLNGYFPCAAEFWIMSIYLPLGIALFQACNTQLLHIVCLQRNYTTDHNSNGGDHAGRKSSSWRRTLLDIHAENKVTRTMAFIGYGMIVQVIATLIIFMISFKFHEGFGVTSRQFSTAAEEEFCPRFISEYRVLSCTQAKKMACRQGWEWLPSIVWQFVWTWCYAPYLLWQLRHVKDVHGWRTQTIFCCVVGLFATPMWLCSLYIPRMAVVNQYYIPPLWFAPSIFLIEAFLIFVPCWQVAKTHRLQAETLSIIAKWETKNNGRSIGGETIESGSQASKQLSVASSTSSRRGEMYTMAALNGALRTNPQPLLMFAALEDFSGENISFLTRVLEWRRKWSPSSPVKGTFIRRPSVRELANMKLQRQQFKEALSIYMSCVSSKLSQYPINLSHVHTKELEAIFEGAVMTVHSSDDQDSNDIATSGRLWQTPPLEDVENSVFKDGLSLTSTQPTVISNHSTENILGVDISNRRRTLGQAYGMINISKELPDWVPIPVGFGPNVFDRAEESIRYMVLTNTWPKFVNARLARTAMAKETGLVHGIRNMFGLKHMEA